MSISLVGVFVGRLPGQLGRVRLGGQAETTVVAVGRTPSPTGLKEQSPLSRPDVAFIEQRVGLTSNGFQALAVPMALMPEELLAVTRATGYNYVGDLQQNCSWVVFLPQASISDNAIASFSLQIAGVSAEDLAKAVGRPFAKIDWAKTIFVNLETDNPQKMPLQVRWLITSAGILGRFIAQAALLGSGEKVDDGIAVINVFAAGYNHEFLIGFCGGRPHPSLVGFPWYTELSGKITELTSYCEVLKQTAVTLHDQLLLEDRARLAALVARYLASHQ